MYKGFWVAGAAYMTWRLGRGALRRLAAITMNNRRRKRELQNIWGGVQVRGLAKLRCSGTFFFHDGLGAIYSMDLSGQDSIWCFLSRSGSRLCMTSPTQLLP